MRQRNGKYIIVGMLVIFAVILGVRQTHFQSVDSYRQEQRQLAKDVSSDSGGANHVGIYCGKLKDGRVVWLHCTSSSGSSLTGNTEGAMFGGYTNFTYFRRLKKWDKK